MIYPGSFPSGAASSAPSFGGVSSRWPASTPTCSGACLNRHSAQILTKPSACHQPWCRAVREAVNRSMTTELCTLCESFERADLATMFPEADGYVREWRLKGCWDDLVTCLPLFLGNIQSLQLDLQNLYDPLLAKVSGSS
jgi:hypothetical protein